MVRPFVALSLLVLPAAASASSDAAWRAFEARVGARCRAASGLAQPHSAATVGFDDTLGKVVTLVSGRERRAGAPRARATKLCVYDQRSGRVWVSEAAGWDAPMQ